MKYVLANKDKPEKVYVAVYIIIFIVNFIMLINEQDVHLYL